MNAEELARVKAAHAQALDLSKEQREEFLREQFADSPDLLAEALHLLDCHSRAGNFLSTPLPPRIFDSGPAAFETRRIGPYELIRKLGDGGSATVYLGRRADQLFEKEVAVKLLNRLAHSEESFRRFQREVQILARLEHAYIVRLLEAGATGEGLSYIVTEFVDGVAIDEYAAGRPLETRLRLLLKVCEGVSAAHRALVVHRDLKPSNILVSADGNPKILDFGIAVLLDRDSRFTRTGLERLTVQYASPEQLRGERTITTSSDVYSLGVLFYRLLAGNLPFEHPENRVGDPRPIRGCPAELQSIARKALQPRVDDRYESVDRFRDDVGRYLAGEPVEAEGDSAGYRLRKFALKHWLAIAGLSAMFVAFAILTAVSIVSSREARRQSGRVRQLVIASLNDSMNDPAHWVPLRFREQIQRARLPFLDALAGDDPNDREVALERFATYRKLGALEGLPASLNLGETEQARQSLGTAVQLGEDLLRRQPSPPSFRGDLALTHIELGTVLLEMGKVEKAQGQFARAAALGGERQDLESMAQHSRILHLRGEDGEALRLRLRVAAERRRLYQHTPGMRWEFAGALCSLGELQREMGKGAEAQLSYAEALPMIEDVASLDPVFLDNFWHLARENEEYAKVLLLIGRQAEAEIHLQRAVELYRQVSVQDPGAMSNQRALAMCLGMLGQQLRRRGDGVRGRQLIAEGLELSEKAAGHDPASSRAVAERDSLRKAVGE